MNRKSLLVVLGLIVLVSLACSLPLIKNPKPTELPKIIEATPTEMKLETLPPPLANVEFSENGKPYPSDWPADLHFPETFKSIDFSQGTLPGGNKPGISLKMRFNGTIQDAADGLRAFLSEKGWKIVDETDLDAGGKLWIIEKDGGGTGMIVIDTQGAEKIVIIATFYV